MTQQSIWEIHDLHSFIQMRATFSKQHCYELLYLLNKQYVIYEMKPLCETDDIQSDEKTFVANLATTVSEILEAFEQGYMQCIIKHSASLYVLTATNKYRRYLLNKQEKTRQDEAIFSLIEAPSSPYEIDVEKQKAKVERGDWVEFDWKGEIIRGYVEDCDVKSVERYIKRAT